MIRFVASELAVRVGARIRELRQERGWRQIDLATHAEVSQTHVSDIELARREVCLYTLERLADALNVQPFELLR